MIVRVCLFLGGAGSSTVAMGWDDRENLRSDSKEWIEVWARLSGEAAPEEYDRKLGEIV